MAREQRANLGRIAGASFASASRTTHARAPSAVEAACARLVPAERGPTRAARVGDGQVAERPAERLLHVGLGIADQESDQRQPVRDHLGGPPRARSTNGIVATLEPTSRRSQRLGL